jgi:hypothetical protein
MKAVATLSLALCVLAFQEPPVRDQRKSEDPKQCNVAKVENRDYCPNCKMFLDETMIEKGLHMKCLTKVVQVRTCIKTAFPCVQHGAGTVYHSRRCCPINVKDCCQEIAILARVEYRCDTCLRRGWTPAQVIHINSRCKGTVEMTCEKSSLYPHGGDPYPAFGTPQIPDRPTP